MNFVVLMGRLTREPSVTIGQDGKQKIAKYSLAVDRGIKRDPNNPDQVTADFISCVAFGRSADFADQYLHQGTKIVVTGRIQTGRYVNKDGATIYTTDVVVNNHEFAESKGNGATTDSKTQSAGAARTTATASASAKADDAFVNVPDGFDEDVPFS